MHPRVFSLPSAFCSLPLRPHRHRALKKTAPRHHLNETAVKNKRHRGMVLAATRCHFCGTAMLRQTSRKTRKNASHTFPSKMQHPLRGEPGNGHSFCLKENGEKGKKKNYQYFRRTKQEHLKNEERRQGEISKRGGRRHCDRLFGQGHGHCAQ